MSIHKNYLLLTDIQRWAADDAFTVLSHDIMGYDLNCMMDDRAERLVEAIATYILESNPV